MSGPPSSSYSEEAKSQPTTDSPADEASDLLKFKSEMGVINKMKVTVLLA